MHAPLAKFSLFGGRRPTPVIYAGPGDVVGGASSFWGLRSYTLAGIGANAVRLREDGGNTEQDFATIAGGGLDLAAIATFKGANNLFVTKVYDQVGTNHFVQATAGNQPRFTLNAIGSLPAMQDNGAGNTLLQSTTLYSVGSQLAQPFTFSIAYRVITTQDGIFVMSSDTTVQVRADFGAANRASLLATTTVTATANDGDWHALQAVLNGAASDVNVDGVANIGTAGLGAPETLASVLDMFAWSGGAARLLGYIGEVGLWPSAFSGANSTAMSANQHTYWGF